VVQEAIEALKTSETTANKKKKKLPSYVMCKGLPKSFHIHLKRGVNRISLITCYVYDIALFLIFSVNLIYHDDNVLAMTELSLLLKLLVLWDPI
jgi:hypothetical protein